MDDALEVESAPWLLEVEAYPTEVDTHDVAMELTAEDAPSDVADVDSGGAEADVGSCDVPTPLELLLDTITGSGAPDVHSPWLQCQSLGQSASVLHVSTHFIPTRTESGGHSVHAHTPNHPPSTSTALGHRSTQAMQTLHPQNRIHRACTTCTRQPTGAVLNMSTRSGSSQWLRGPPVHAGLGHDQQRPGIQKPCRRSPGSVPLVAGLGDGSS